MRWTNVSVSMLAFGMFSYACHRVYNGEIWNSLSAIVVADGFIRMKRVNGSAMLSESGKPHPVYSNTSRTRRNQTVARTCFTSGIIWSRLADGVMHCVKFLSTEFIWKTPTFDGRTGVEEQLIVCKASSFLIKTFRGQSASSDLHSL